MAKKAPYYILASGHAFESDGNLLCSVSLFIYKRDGDELMDEGCFSPKAYAALNRYRLGSAHGYLYSFELAELAMEEARKIMKVARVLGRRIEGPSSDADLVRLRALIDSVLSSPEEFMSMKDWGPEA